MHRTVDGVTIAAVVVALGTHLAGVPLWLAFLAAVFLIVVLTLVRDE